MTEVSIVPAWGPSLERAALALAHGATQADAAEYAGTSDRNIRRWLGRDEFRHRVASYRAQHVHELERQLSGLQSKAVAALDDLLDSPQPQVRLGAARTVLDFGQRAREEGELLRRIQNLEACALEAEEQS